MYIAQEGVGTADVFRRPGNPNDTRRIVKRLTEGKQVIYANYSFYTLASVVKVRIAPISCFGNRSKLYLVLRQTLCRIILCKLDVM